MKRIKGKGAREEQRAGPVAVGGLRLEVGGERTEGGRRGSGKGIQCPILAVYQANFLFDLTGKLHPIINKHFP